MIRTEFHPLTSNHATRRKSDQQCPHVLEWPRTNFDNAREKGVFVLVSTSLHCYPTQVKSPSDHAPILRPAAVVTVPTRLIHRNVVRHPNAPNTPVPGQLATLSSVPLVRLPPIAPSKSRPQIQRTPRSPLHGTNVLFMFVVVVVVPISPNAQRIAAATTTTATAADCRCRHRRRHRRRSRCRSFVRSFVHPNSLWRRRQRQRRQRRRRRRRQCRVSE